MLDNELNAILDDIENNKGLGISSEQSKFKTSDFSLDSILREYGIYDEPAKKSAPVKQAESIVLKKEESEAEIPPMDNTKTDETAIKEVKPEEPVAAEPIVEELQPEEPIAAEPAVEETKITPDANAMPEKAVKEQSFEDIFAAAVKDKKKPIEKTSPKVSKDNHNIFDNQDIVSMLAANKLGKTNEKGESTASNGVTQIFSAEQEEDFKMRSGYIDIEAIRAATAKIQLNNTKEDDYPTPPKMSTDQKILVGKIGSFFADTTFKYDTSTVNDISVTFNKKKKKANKNQTAEVTENVKEDFIAEGDIMDAKDIPNVEQEMLSQINISVLKAILTGILAIPLAILNIFPAFVENILYSVSPANPFNYAAANLAILLIIAIININIIIKGIIGLFSLKPTSSSLASLSVITALIHCCYLMINPQTIGNMYCVVAALIVMFVLIGKYIYYRNIYKNLEILAFNAPKTACVNVEGGHSLNELYNSRTKAVSCRPVNVLTHFLTNSFDYNFADKLANFTILGAIVIALLIAAYTGISGQAVGIFEILSCAFAIIAPFAFDISYSLPLNTSSNKIRKTGSSVLSYTVAKEYSNTTELIICDSDLFKPENIVVHSMKINGNEKINDIIINCASLIKASNSPVSYAFLNILDNKESMLMPVTNFDWAPNKGYSGDINGTKYYVGSSRYLADCGIKLPTIDLEEKYKRIGRQVIMFADSHKLLAVFSISYNRNEAIYNNLHKISLDNMRILVLTKDNNITSELLDSIYEVGDNSFVIASKEEYERIYHNEKPMDKCPAGIYSITGSSGITSALSNCKRLMSTVKISVIFRTVSLLACIALFVFACLTNNVTALLSAKNIILFHLIWIVPPLFISVFAG